MEPCLCFRFGPNFPTGHSEVEESCCFLINYHVLGTASADSSITVNPHYVHLRTCKFACLPKRICNPKINIMAFSWSFTDIRRTTKKVSHLMHAFPAEVKQGEALPSCFSSHTINKCPYDSLFNVFFFFFFCICFCCSHCWKWLQDRAKVLPRAPKRKKGVRCLREKIHVKEPLFKHEIRVLLAVSSKFK